MIGNMPTFDPASAIIVLDGLLVILAILIACQNFTILNRIARIEQQMGLRSEDEVWGDVPAPPTGWTLTDNGWKKG